MRVALASITLVSWAACVAPSSASELGKESPVAAEVVTIPDTGNVRVGTDLELGAGNIWADAADGGDGLSAGLWILAKKVSLQRKHHRVKAGQELSESGYRLKVLEVVKKPERSYVRVEVQAAK